MKKSGIQNPELQIDSWEQAKLVMHDYAETQARVAKDRAKMDAEILAVTEKYADSIGNAELALEVRAQALKSFAKAHKKEFVAKEDGGPGRTRVYAGVELGFALSPPYVSVAKKKFDAAVDWLKEFAGDTYVRFKPELAKDRLKADLIAAQDARDQATIDKFAGHGITLDQDDDFVLKLTTDH